MKSIIYLLVFIGISLSTLSFSQDIHFTNYHYSPLYLSPTKTGAFRGTYRVGANVRDQFSSFIETPYQTFMAYGDMPIGFGFKPHHWIGVGLNVYTDRAGLLNFQNSGAHISIAYHLAVDPKYKTVFSFGLQYGTTQRKINSTNYSSFETLNGNLADPDLTLLQDFNPSISDLNIGLSMKRWTSKDSYIDFGVSIYHLLQSSYRFSGSTIDNPISNRINIYGEYYIQSTDQLALRPTVVYSRIYQFQNLFGQFNLEYKLKKKGSNILKGGIGYRANDAIQLLAGMIFRGWDVGIAYDLTVSSAAEFNNRFGGIELGVRKIFTINRVPKVNAKALCPRL